MKFFTCKKGCCTVKTTQYVYDKKGMISKNRRKAGVCIHDPKTDKVLMVQSRGNLWGLPKGTLEDGETSRKCAIREVNEETGLDVIEDDFTKALNIKNTAVYFYMQKEECDVNVQDHIVGNDANSIGWIKRECMVDFVTDGTMVPNKHCVLVFKSFLDVELKN